MLAKNDKFGFYTVGNFKTYSKLEAIEHSAKVKVPVTWNFNCEKFSKLDWTQEPPGTLEFWYEQRARQLRDQYDYIVLWYSGGADSHNVLMSFVKNNIFIDEIAQFHNLSARGGNKDTWLNNEVFYTSIPQSQQLIENNPIYKNTKHRTHDLSDLQKQVLTMEDNKWDYFYLTNRYASPSNMAVSYIRETDSDYRKLMDQGKKVCFLFGAEKPTIEKNGNDWYMVFEDKIDYVANPRMQRSNNPCDHNEMFYWNDRLPELIVKQAHVIKRFLQNLTPSAIDNVNVSSYKVLLDEYGRKPADSWYADVVVNNTRYQLLADGLHKLIYPYWSPGGLLNSKPASLVQSPRDVWYFDSQAPNVGQKYYTYGIVKMREKIKKINPEYWWEFKFDPSTGIPYTGGTKPLTNKYCIG